MSELPGESGHALPTRDLPLWGPEPDFRPDAPALASRKGGIVKPNDQAVPQLLTGD